MIVSSIEHRTLIALVSAIHLFSGHPLLHAASTDLCFILRDYRRSISGGSCINLERLSQHHLFDDLNIACETIETRGDDPDICFETRGDGFDLVYASVQISELRQSLQISIAIVEITINFEILTPVIPPPIPLVSPRRIICHCSMMLSRLGAAPSAYQRRYSRVSSCSR